MENTLEESFRKEMLVSDFQQCMEMLRHYDGVNWDLTKFSFGQLLIVIGACWTILVQERNGNETLMDVLRDGNTNYIVGGILLLSTFFLYLTLIAILRNRCYFVLMSRYINEHRDNILKEHPFGFQNDSNMWHDCNFPNIIDWKSTQFAFTYLFFFLCVLLLFFSFYCLLLCTACCLCLSALITVALIFIGGYVLYEIVH